MSKRADVLIAVKDWLSRGGGAQDILDDFQLFNAVNVFLQETSDPMSDKSGLADFPPVHQAWDVWYDTWLSVKSMFKSQTQRPSVTRSHNRVQGVTRNARTRNASTRDPPDLDRMDPEEFVDNLDGMASAAFSNVTQEVRDVAFARPRYLTRLVQDLYITADLLEVQTSDRTGWFSPREMATNEELVEIQTIYSHIQEVEPSSSISDSSQDALYRLLPPGVRSCIRAYSIIRRWLISKLVAPRIGLRARQARMELLIQAIEVSRLRNTETPSATQFIEQPCVRSFVEAVTTSALLSVESRLHHRAWQSVALSRGSIGDSLSSLLHRPYVQSTSRQESLTVDVGWLLERMIEIIATPDVIEATSQEGQQLVNFDKRRSVPLKMTDLI